MTRMDNELDDYGKNVLAPLQEVSPMDPKVMEIEKARFMLNGENLRKSMIPRPVLVQSKRAERKPGIFSGFLSLPVFKAVIVVIVVMALIAGSSITVYAAQSSLPGEPLYSVKSLSEDVRLSVTFSTRAKLDLTLDYTNRRMGEINNLISKGNALPDSTSDRFQQELEQALELAAQMDDQQMQAALRKIKVAAENQGMSIDELIAGLPEQASPAIVHLQERLQEQVQLSDIGEKNPQAFRNQIRERVHHRQGPKGPSTSDKSGTNPIMDETPVPGQQDKGNGNGNGLNKPTDEPGQDKPGNGNHGPNPTHVP